MRKKMLEISDNKRVRLIIDTDTNCEGDDQYAIAHALMCSKVDVVGIIAEHYRIQTDADSMMKSYHEALHILKLMGCEETPLYYGAKVPMTEEQQVVPSDAVNFIVKECKKDDLRPLFIITQGAMTNLAGALLSDPIVEEKLVCISIGGCNYPYGGFEFNYMNDIIAAETVMKSRMEVWQVPAEVYTTMQTGFAELYKRVRPCGKLGEYLFEHLKDVQTEMTRFVPKLPGVSDHEYALSFPNGESWSLGDSCGIGILTAANAGEYIYESAPQILQDGTYYVDDSRRKIRIYKNIDSRFILEDFFAKLEYYFG